MYFVPHFEHAKVYETSIWTPCLQISAYTMVRSTEDHTQRRSVNILVKQNTSQAKISVYYLSYSLNPFHAILRLCNCSYLRLEVIRVRQLIALLPSIFGDLQISDKRTPVVDQHHTEKVRLRCYLLGRNLGSISTRPLTFIC